MQGTSHTLGIMLGPFSLREKAGMRGVLTLTDSALSTPSPSPLPEGEGKLYMRLERPIP